MKLFLNMLHFYPIGTKAGTADVHKKKNIVCEFRGIRRHRSSALWKQYCTSGWGFNETLSSWVHFFFFFYVTVHVVVVYQHFGWHGIPQERQPQIHPGWRLKPRISILLFTFFVRFWWNWVSHIAHNAVKQSWVSQNSSHEGSYFLRERSWKCKHESNANPHVILVSKERLGRPCTTSRQTPYVFSKFWQELYF